MPAFKLGPGQHPLEQRQVHAARDDRELLRQRVEGAIAQSDCRAVGIRFIATLGQMLDQGPERRARGLLLLSAARWLRLRSLRTFAERATRRGALLTRDLVERWFGSATFDRRGEQMRGARVFPRGNGDSVVCARAPI